MRFVAHADGVPLLGDLRTSAVIGAVEHDGGTATPEPDRPRPSFWRRPAKGAAFLKARMSSTATTREGIIRGEIAPSGLRAGSPAHAAHTLSSRGGQCCLIGHCEVTVRSPAVRDGFESADAFCYSLELPRLGLTT